MRPVSQDNPNYIVAESLENYSIPFTEYIPRDFRRVRHPNLSWVGAFLIALSEGMTVKNAADRAGVSRGEVYFEREQNADFKTAWEDAIRLNTETLEGVAHDRATDKSDLLMMFLLKAREPAKYNEKYQAQTGSGLKLEIHHHYPAEGVENTTIEVESRAVEPDVKQLEVHSTKQIDVSARKD